MDLTPDDIELLHAARRGELRRVRRNPHMSIADGHDVRLLPDGRQVHAGNGIRRLSSRGLIALRPPFGRVSEQDSWWWRPTTSGREALNPKQQEVPMPTHQPAPAAQSDLMTPKQVARAFVVDPKTVTRWAKAGKLTAIRTPGGHRRFWRHEVEALLAGGAQ